MHLYIPSHCAKNEMALYCYFFHHQAKIIMKWGKIHMQQIYLDEINLIIITQKTTFDTCLSHELLKIHSKIKNHFLSETL